MKHSGQGTPLAYAAKLFSAAFGAALLAACATVRVEGGDKPVEVNLNVKIDQEVRVRLDREIEDLISQNPDIF